MNSSELTVGYAGCDGIEFRLRANAPSVWAYYPIEESCQLLGTEIVDAVAGWLVERNGSSIASVCRNKGDDGFVHTTDLGAPTILFDAMNDRFGVAALQL